MSMARFSPFELVLLKSRSQVDTATLLLLAWVLVHRQHVSEGQRRRRLAQVTAQFRHGHELGPVMGIAHSQDLQAIQLAAEILRKECSKERSLSVLHQSITVATDDGELSLANHYILRFLADLLNVTPTTLSTLFYELTGRPMGAPEDPSRHTYWQQHNPDYFSQKARDAAAEQQAREDAERQAQEKAEQREQKKQRKQQENNVSRIRRTRVRSKPGKSANVSASATSSSDVNRPSESRRVTSAPRAGSGSHRTPRHLRTEPPGRWPCSGCRRVPAEATSGSPTGVWPSCTTRTVSSPKASIRWRLHPPVSSASKTRMIT